MTVPATTTAAARAAPTVPFVRVLRAAARQHRAALASLVAVELALAALTMAAGEEAGGPFETREAQWVVVRAVAVFLAAPLLAREFERDTYRWAWTQDIAPRRWLLGRVVLLGGTVAVAATVVGLALDARTQPPWNEPASGVLETDLFGSWGWQEAVWAMVAFALGLALSALLRRRLPAMALTVAGLYVVGVVRDAAAEWFGGLGLTRIVYPLHAELPADPPGLVEVDAGYLDTAGRPTKSIGACHLPTDGSEPRGPGCTAEDSGLSQQYADYQSQSHTGLFHLIELGVLVALAAALVAVAMVAVRRATTRG